MAKQNFTILQWVSLSLLMSGCMSKIKTVWFLIWLALSRKTQTLSGELQIICGKRIYNEKKYSAQKLTRKSTAVWTDIWNYMA